VAEQVVGAADPWIDVAPVRRVLRPRKDALGDKQPTGHARLGSVAVEVVVADTQVERQLPDGPLILRVGRDVARAPQRFERYGPDGDLLRNAIPERVGTGAVDL